MTYDYHCHFENLEEGVRIAESLGLSGICATINWTKQKDFEEFKERISGLKTRIDVAVAVELDGKAGRVRDLAKFLRKHVDIISVHGGDSAVNRIAIETPEVDILIHPEFKREDSGFDHVMAKLSKKNNVAIEFSFSDLIYTYKKDRASILSKLLENAKLVKKFGSPFVLTSGAFNEWNLRSGSELLSFGRVLGFNDKQIKHSLSDWIIKENRKKLGKGFVMPGVEIIKD